MMRDGQIRARVQTRHRVVERTLIIDLGGRRRVLSSAPHGGGFTLASYILNHQVEAHPSENGCRPTHFPNPSRTLRILADRLGVGKDTVGLMTAVPMTQLVRARARVGDLWVECFATVGVTNAVCAGEWPTAHTQRKSTAHPGTINLILITNGHLSHAALVGTVQVATEAKTGLLREYAVPSCQSQATATGTGTDAVVIASQLRGQGPLYQYSGTHTIIGALMGQVVAHCVAEGLEKAKAWQKRHQ
ncbi:MAG: hypothetical protein FJ244_00615 [Nitrospira sp.]|nr:hypothetical protein [Nitrospira sp.]